MKGLDSYIDGDWVNATSNLQNAKMIMPFDGPLCWLSDYLDSRKNLAPEDWKGVRDLDQKHNVPELENTAKLGDLGALGDQDANPE